MRLREVLKCLDEWLELDENLERFEMLLEVLKMLKEVIKMI
jgi:hypothetical protein